MPHTEQSEEKLKGLNCSPLSHPLLHSGTLKTFILKVPQQIKRDTRHCMVYIILNIWAKEEQATVFAKTQHATYSELHNNKLMC